MKKMKIAIVSICVMLSLQGCSSSSKCGPSDRSYYCIEKAVKKGLGQ